MFKIGLVGSFSTGKSEVINALKKERFNKLKVYYIDEIARMVHEQFGLPIDRDTDLDTELLMFALQIGAESNVPNDVDIVILDRTLLDYLSYLTYFINNNILKVSYELYLLLYSLVKDKMKDCNLVCYFPIEVPITDDGVRELDEQYRKDIDEMILFYLDEFHIPYEVLNGNIESKVKKLVKMMEDIMKEKAVWSSALIPIPKKKKQKIAPETELSGYDNQFINSADYWSFVGNY